jgi:hypothetical protein
MESRFAKIGKRVINLADISQIVPEIVNGGPAYRISLRGEVNYFLEQKTFPEDYAELSTIIDRIPRLHADIHQLSCFKI